MWLEGGLGSAFQALLQCPIHWGWFPGAGAELLVPRDSRGTQRKQSRMKWPCSCAGSQAARLTKRCRHLGCSQRARAHFVCLGFGNLPDYPRKDNGITFPEGFFPQSLLPLTGFPFCVHLCRVNFQQSLGPLIPPSTCPVHSSVRCHFFTVQIWSCKEQSQKTYNSQGVIFLYSDMLRNSVAISF